MGPEVEHKAFFDFSTLAGLASPLFFILSPVVVNIDRSFLNQTVLRTIGQLHMDYFARNLQLL